MLTVAARGLADQPTGAERAATENLESIEKMGELEIPDDELDPSLIGLPVVRVEVKVRGKKWTKKVEVKSVAFGEPLSPEVARRAMREVDEAGSFAGLAAEAERSGSGALLRIVAVPSRRISGVQIDGGLLDRAQTLKAAAIEAGTEVTEEDVAELPRRLTALYDHHGFPRAKVTAEAAVLDHPDEVLISVHVEPGEPRLVSQRIFVIEPEWDVHVGDLKSDYAVEAGDRLDQAQCDDADRKLTEALRQAGFYRARVYHKTLYRGAFSYLYVYVDSGPKLVPLFEGNLAFDTDQLQSALEIDKGTVLDRADLATRLRRHYVAHGFYDVEVEVEPRTSADRGLEYVTFVVREHDRVRVDKRVFVCLPPDEDPDEVGREMDRVLEETLPSGGIFSVPTSRVVVSTVGAQGGKRAEPLDVAPAAVYTPDAYAKALKRARELYLGKGYLNVVAGPATVLRAACAPHSPPGECIEEPIPKAEPQCKLDGLGRPLPEPPPPQGSTCVPDPHKGVRCSPRITLRIPMHLGPKTRIWDVVFDGNENVTDTELAAVADLPMGEPLSLQELEDKKAKIAEHYQDLGFAYVEIRADVDPSPDGTRARIRFRIEERDPVIIDGIDVEGASRTDVDLIVGRVAFKRGDRYSKKGLRLSEERIATLGPFSSVSVTLAEPEVPRRRKRLLVRVTEYTSQYIEPRVGFSTGEGLRVGFEYGHRNIGGEAISLTLRLQLSYLFDFMIIDSAVEENLAPLPISQRLERRNSVRVNFPEIGLGPLVGLGIEGIDVRDNQRDFGLTREALVPSIYYRPIREVTTALGVSAELNDVQIFNADSVDDAIRKNRSLERLLRFPDGTTFAVAQRISVAWDRRDNPLAATSGTLLTGDAEHVNAFPASEDDPNTDPLVSHFLKLTNRVAAYVRFTDSGLALAMSLSGGLNIQLAEDSRTYPDRLFFLGGFESIRSFLSDSCVPQDVADRIEAGEITVDEVAVRGGDLFVNPRVELRIPVTATIGLGVFLDIANLWVDPLAFDPLAWRYGAGAGIRWTTPLGPLVLDYGFNLDPKPWEDVGALHFSVGLF
jgi:outer membrane protein assembly factor BamA